MAAIAVWTWTLFPMQYITCGYIILNTVCLFLSILFKLGGGIQVHNISDEFDNQPYRTNDLWVMALNYWKLTKLHVVLAIQKGWPLKMGSIVFWLWFIIWFLQSCLHWNNIWASYATFIVALVGINIRRAYNATFTIALVLFFCCFIHIFFLIP